MTSAFGNSLVGLHEPPAAAGDAGEPPLLGSKLTVPAQPGNMQARPRLQRLLDSNDHHPIIVLNAPAGWGKSVLLAGWARSRERHLGWLSLEEGDGPRFWSYLRATVRASTVLPNRALPPAPGKYGDNFVKGLAAVLNAPGEPLTVVLDGLQRVRDPHVLGGIDFLSRHAGERLCLVIATRSGAGLPLARWRLEGRVCEVGAAQLSFDFTEAAGLLTELGLDVPQSCVEVLLERTEGWPAGLRLACLAMRQQLDPLRFADRLTGDREDIAGYLASEVLAGLSGQARDLLMCGSVVEALTSSAAEALTGRPDAGRALAELQDEGVLLGTAGEPPPGSRCHRLLREFLQAEITRRSASRAPDLHRRAAAWYAAGGEPGRSLRHALCAKDWHLASRTAAAHWRDLVLCRQDRAWPLPAPPEDALREEPEAALACALYEQMRDDTDSAGRYLRLVNLHLAEAGTDDSDRLRVMTAAVLLGRALSEGDSEELLSQARKLGAHRDGEEGTRALVFLGLGTARLGTGDLSRAQQALQSGLAAAERGGSVRARTACSGRLAAARALAGDLGHAQRTARASIGLASDAEDCGYGYLALAVVHYEWSRIDDADRYLDLAVAGADQLLAALIALVRAKILQFRGAHPQALGVLRGARHDPGGRVVPAYIADHLTAAEVFSSAATGDLTTASRLLPHTTEALDTQGTSATLALASARLRLACGDAHAAARIAAHVTTAEKSLRIEARLVEALAADHLGDTALATACLEESLRLADAEGFRRVFFGEAHATRRLLAAQLKSGTSYEGFVIDLLQAGAERLDVPDTERPGMLTEREGTVLRYLQSDLTIAEIAAELHVSVNTVKSHLQHIYSKLGVSQRRDAVRKARELWAL
ncbi:LuxR C-terminal-related transcriptional regulator [Actinomadura nitritigenes]|uniref:HTH luxR-type domain-containing protein n=1 Tax=Actinomadura nitritigenes TaxID=134602 RepID=A0ABS3RC89_9ACTN|nr:LuxR C-terminal-related transcriptional regulator [Actinomadura nitritigenes]MBO2443847.1 hypothetical protein [Actinomadura nitritigenes]